VWELAAQINAAAMDVYSWSIARILDHRSSTRRKVDIRFLQKQKGYSINALRTRILKIHGGAPPIEPPEVDDVFLPVREGDGMGDKGAKQSDVAVVQRLLNEDFRVNPKLTTDGKYGSQTTRAVKQVFPNESGNQVGGQQYFKLQKVAFA
jgi:hypothetical protein